MSPNGDNKFKIEYTYGISGQLTSYKEPFGEIVNYGHDKTGKLKTVVGNRTVENVQLNYVTNADYRAWGAVKKVDQGNIISTTISYNNRLQAQQYDFGSVRLQYTYYNDGRLKFSDTDYNTTGNIDYASNFDRLYEYDFLGRLKKAKTGAESRGQTETEAINRPYRMTLNYNQYGEIVNQERLHYLMQTIGSFQYQNGRLTSENNTQYLQYWDNVNVNSTHTFDADGRTNDEGQKYNADGKLISYNGEDYTNDFTHFTEISYDGNGNTIISDEKKIVWCNNPNRYQCWDYQRKKYRIVSSVIRETLSEITKEKATRYTSFEYFHRETSIYASGAEIAKRSIRYIGGSYQSESTSLKSTDPSGVEHIDAPLNGEFAGYVNFLTTDPFGAGVAYENPYPEEPPEEPNDCVDYRTKFFIDDFDQSDECEYPEFQDPESEEEGAGSIPENTCYKDGFEVNCEEALRNIDPDTPVTKEDEFPDQSPSTTGPKAIWQDDDSSDDHTNPDSIELEFEAQYTGNVVSFTEAAGVGVTVSGSSDYGTVSSLDLQVSNSSSSQPQTRQDNGLITTEPGRVSTNFTPRRLPQEDCDFLINSKFGNMNSVVTTVNNPKNHPRLKGSNYEIHLWKNGALHIYGNETGSARSSPLYLPLDTNGKQPQFLGGYNYQEENSETFTNVFRWKYENGLVIEFFHIGGTTSKTSKIDSGLRGTEKLGDFSNQKNLVGSIQIGYIGGLGGNSSSDYIHSHLNFKVNGVRVDPRGFFCAGY